jgi:magnesium transporter
MIDIYFKTVRDTDFHKIDDFKPGSWIYVHQATLDDLYKIGEITGLDISDLKDSLDRYELPRIEPVKDNLIFFIRHPGNQEEGLYTEAFTIIFTPSFVIAISPTKSEIIEQLITNNNPLVGTTQKTKLLLHILLKITQDYTNSIKKARQSIVGYSTMTSEHAGSDSILKLTQNEEILNQYLTSLVPMRNLLETVVQGNYVSFYEKDLDLLESLMIGIRQSEDICQVNIKSIRSLRDSYHIIFTNNVNRTIKLLTALTIIFSIPNTIASFYGMNVTLPFQNQIHAFGLILIFTVILAALAAFWFVQKKWF